MMNKILNGYFRGNQYKILHCCYSKNYAVQSPTNIFSSSIDPHSLDERDIGKLYLVSEPDLEGLEFHNNLPRNFGKQIKTLKECAWMYRKQTHEAFDCIKSFESEQSALRLVIWGKFGTGKTITLCQLVHLAYTQGFVLLIIPDAMRWSRDNYHEVQVSTYKQGRINSPLWSTKLLKYFKLQNRHIWDKISSLKTSKKYYWSQIECTEEGRPINEIVEMGLSAPYLATDCFGAICKELRIHATKRNIKLFVAIDKANGLYGKTVVKRPDRTIANSNELTLTIHLRKFLMPIWSNGLCAMVADKAEISDSRDSLSVPVNDPRTIMGEEGFEQIQPFVSVKTSLYSSEEINVMHEYYLKKNWLYQEEGPKGQEAKKQLISLSAMNPEYFERICAMSWKLGCTFSPRSLNY